MDYIPAKHILIRSKSTVWFGTDHTVNLYRGCCHGCLYCASRSECYPNPTNTPNKPPVWRGPDRAVLL